MFLIVKIFKQPNQFFFINILIWVYFSFFCSSTLLVSELLGIWKQVVLSHWLRRVKWTLTWWYLARSVSRRLVRWRRPRTVWYPQVIMFTVPYPLSRPLRAPGLRALSSAPSRSHLPPTPCHRPCTDCSLPASPPSSRRTHVLTSSFTYSSPSPPPRNWTSNSTSLTDSLC